MEATTKTCGRILRISIMGFLALMTASCATAGSREHKIKQSLNPMVQSFNSDIRWQDFQGAEVFVPKDQDASYWAQVDRLKRDIRLTEFEIRDIEFSRHDRLARVIVHYRYWRLDSPILRGVTVTQTWRYFKDHKEGMWKVSDSGLEALTGTFSAH